MMRKLRPIIKSQKRYTPASPAGAKLLLLAVARSAGYTAITAGLGIRDLNSLTKGKTYTFRMARRGGRLNNTSVDQDRNPARSLKLTTGRVRGICVDPIVWYAGIILSSYIQGIERKCGISYIPK